MNSPIPLQKLIVLKWFLDICVGMDICCGVDKEQRVAPAERHLCFGPVSYEGIAVEVSGETC